MARVFVRLKLRLLRNRLSTGGFLAAVGFLLIWLGSFTGGVAGAAVFGVLARVADESISSISVLIHAGVGFVWVIVPIVVASLDESMEARSFELFPFTDRQLATGLLLAGMVGPGTLATVLVLALGSLLAFADGARFVPLLVVSLVATALAVVTARWATTRLSDLLRHRRGQEVAVIVVVVLASIPGIFSITLAESAADGASVTEMLERVAGVVQWTPWGALGRSAAAIGAGEWLIALGFLAYGALATVGVLALFGRALRRLAVVAPSAPVSTVNRAGSTLLPRRVPLPPTAAGAVAAKELAYVRRDVRVRSQLLGGGIAVVVLGFAGGSVALGTAFAPFLAVFAVFIVVTAVTPNQFGFDGGSFWAYLTVVEDLGSVIRGKNLGWTLIAAPLALVVALVTAFLSGEWVYVPAALLASAVIALIWLGVGNITSILGAFRLPDTNLFASRNVSGGAFLATMIGIGASGFLTFPPLIAVGVLVLLAGPLWATVATLVSLVYAIVVYRLASRHAARLAHARRFKLLETLDGD